jgi:periplasmic protein TonB
MTTLLYRPPQSRQLWTAFACAIAIHSFAVSVAWSVSGPPSNFWPPGDQGPVTGESPIEAQAPLVDLTPIEAPEAVQTDDEVPQEHVTPALVHSAVRRAISNSVKAGLSGPSFGSARALAIYAPRPAYPYEARKHRTMGTGSVDLIVDLSTGRVIEARMAQSTGSVALDNSAVSGLRTWRFKPGTVSRVRVPITYTLSGVSY